MSRLITAVVYVLALIIEPLVRSRAYWKMTPAQRQEWMERQW